MDHALAETLLGAYALDAVDRDEARELAEHVDECPRCAAELAAHAEVAGALGNFGAEAPEGLWSQIVSGIDRDARPTLPPTPPLGRPLRAGASHRARPSWRAAAVASIAAAAIAVLTVQVVHLGSEVDSYQSATAAAGLAPLVAQVALGPHQTVELASSESDHRASIEIGPGAVAYWTGANLQTLATDRTYQVWAIAGGRLVSVGLIGSDPHAYAQLHLARNMTRLLVTEEPEGGTPAPTSAVLVEAPLPPLT